MSLRSLLTLASLGLLAVITGCTPAPPPPPPKAPVVEEPPPPPPPPPKCEALAEGCVAKAGLRVKLNPLEWTIEPPESWKYAVGPDDVVADSAGGVLVVTTFEAPADKKPAGVKAKNAKRDEIITKLLGKLEIERSKKLAFPPKPHKSSKVENVDVALYQFDGSKRSGEAGPLLVFLSQLDADHVLVGVGFVAERDTTNADAAILKAIASLRAAAALGDAGAPAVK